jgi:hypothetical protein
MSHFGNIAWSANTAKADTKTEDESTSEEHSMGCGGCLDASADDDNDGSHEHAHTAPENIVDGTRENDSWDRANVIDGKYQAGA